jgi:hypothetical protein
MQDALFYVEVGVFHAGQALLPQPMRTVQTSTQLWGFWMECPLRLCDIPPATRLCITLFCRRKSLKEDIPLGWVNHQLFNYKGLLCVGAQNLCLWLGAKANPIGTCSHNQESAMPLLLTLEFPSFDRPVRYTSPPIWTTGRFLNFIPFFFMPVLSPGFLCLPFLDTDIRSLQFVIPPDSLKATLEAIISKGRGMNRNPECMSKQEHTHHPSPLQIPSIDLLRMRKACSGIIETTCLSFLKLFQKS